MTQVVKNSSPQHISLTLGCKSSIISMMLEQAFSNRTSFLLDRRILTRFQIHFEAIHTFLKIVRVPTMKSTAYHQANMLQTRVLTEIQVMKSSVDHALSQINTSQTTDPPNQDQMCILTTQQDNIVIMMENNA